MRPLNTYIISFLLVFISRNALQAQDIPVDKRSFERVIISEKRLEQYRKDKNFDYVAKGNEETVFTKAVKWLKQKIYNLLRKFFTWLLGAKKGMKLLKLFIKILPYIAVFIFAYLIFRFLIGVDLIELNKSKQIRKAKVVNLNDEEIIKEADLDGLIKEAINEKDYRLAIRYYYLKTLKKLLDKELIDWHPDKTNRDYVNELKINDLKNMFKHLTFIYDYVWYGKFTPAEEEFAEIKNDFNKFVIP